MTGLPEPAHGAVPSLAVPTRRWGEWASESAIRRDVLPANDSRVLPSGSRLQGVFGEPCFEVSFGVPAGGSAAAGCPLADDTLESLEPSFERLSSRDFCRVRKEGCCGASRSEPDGGGSDA